MRENIRIGSVIMIIAGLVLDWLSATNEKQRALLETTGIEVFGSVESASVKIKVGRKSGTRYWIYVKYMPASHEPVLQGFEVKEAFFKSITQGDLITTDTVQVVYSASDPKEAIIRGGSVAAKGAGGAGIMLFIAMLGGAGFLGSFLPGRKKQSAPPPLPPPGKVEFIIIFQQADLETDEPEEVFQEPLEEALEESGCGQWTGSGTVPGYFEIDVNTISPDRARCLAVIRSVLKKAKAPASTLIKELCDPPIDHPLHAP